MTENDSSLYTMLLKSGDHRTNKWLFVSSPVPSLIFVIFYVLMVKTAPHYFRDRKPIYLRPYIISYNIILVFFSAYMAKEFFLSAYLGNFSLICQPNDVSYDPLAMRLANVFWWFYISKAVEVVDTIFIILGKKYSQLTFLHFFHHTTMVFNQWMATKYFPGGHGFLLGFLNSTVHVVMYSYYCLACFPALRKYLWWKKYLTSLQLLQFMLVIVHCCVGAYSGCIFPRWTVYYVMGYAFVLVVMFTNFYVKTYKTPSEKDYLSSLQNGATKSHEKHA